VKKAYLKLDGSPRLKAAAWIHYQVAKRLAAASGLDLTRLMNDAQSRDFKPVPLSVRLRAHIVSKIRLLNRTTSLPCFPASDGRLKRKRSCIRRTTTDLGIRPDMPRRQNHL